MLHRAKPCENFHPTKYSFASSYLPYQFVYYNTKSLVSLSRKNILMSAYFSNEPITQCRKQFGQISTIRNKEIHLNFQNRYILSKADSFSQLGSSQVVLYFLDFDPFFSLSVIIMAKTNIFALEEKRQELNVGTVFVDILLCDADLHFQNFSLRQKIICYCFRRTILSIQS